MENWGQWWSTTVPSEKVVLWWSSGGGRLKPESGADRIDTRQG